MNKFYHDGTISHTTSRWKAKKPFFCKAIRLQFPILECSDLVLLHTMLGSAGSKGHEFAISGPRLEGIVSRPTYIILSVSIQSGKVQIRRGLRVVEVSMICLKEIMDNQRCPIEEDARHIVRMRLELLSRHHAVKNESWIRQRPRRDGIWRYRTSIGGICRA